MRDIKFRAWLPKEKKYVDVKDMLLNTYHSSFIKVIGTIHDAL